jgi:hypothetical protein
VFSSGYTAFFGAVFVSTAAFAQPETCQSEYWPGTLPEHEVDSVDVSELQRFLDTSPAIEGIEFETSLHGDGEVWLDIVRFPGEVTVLASLRTVLIVGRVVKPQYKKLVLADNGEGVFEVPYADLHRIGCQFVWSEGKGQNPIALMRDLADKLGSYPNGARVAPPFNGSLLGDTTTMLTTMNQIVYPKWVLKTVEIK